MCCHAAASNCKAQTSSGCPPVRPGGTLKIDQGRSLLRAPQECLRYLMRTSTGQALRPDRSAHTWDLVARATSVHRRARAHTLVAPTIHLSKSKANFRSQTPMATFVTIVVSFLHRVIPDWGGGIISFVSAVSTAVAKILSQGLRGETVDS